MLQVVAPHASNKGGCISGGAVMLGESLKALRAKRDQSWRQVERVRFKKEIVDLRRAFEETGREAATGSLGELPVDDVPIPSHGA